MTMKVLSAGLQTSVQDLGRFGYRQLGIGVSGALDGYSLRVGNWLVGNDENAAALEITLQGPRLHFERAVRIAITGADVEAQTDGIVLPGWRPIDLPAGCELRFGPCRRGARAYFTVAGGIDVAIALGSASTDLRAGFGGFEGRCLMAGDSLSLATTSGTAPWGIDPEPDLEFGRPTTIRVLPGRDGTMPMNAFCDDLYRVSAQSNRQGVRLQGAALTIADSRERLSEPVAPGTVQLPPDGQPIVLLAEAQTTGGYPRIGHVVSADLPRLAQLRPGDSLRFEMIDWATAQELACAQRRRLSRIALAIEQRRHDG
jgi:antagonist of KipI